MLFANGRAACLALILAFLTATCGVSRRPNVLVITLDTTRADHLGAYGYPLARTPVMDRLAAEGIRCSDAISAAPITMPAHTSIFTGLFPPAHGVRDNGAYALSDDAVTLAERLRAAGYTTHAFVSAIVLSRRYNLNQGFETYDDDLWSENDPPLFMIRSRRADRTTDRFLQWFSKWDEQKPFFTWVHFFDAHQPYRTPIGTAPTPYDAQLAFIDQNIGRMVDSLRARHVLDDTIIVVAADHGESLGEHGEQTHAIFVYDATVHIPLIWRYRPRLAHRVYEGPVRSVDIAPTILAMTGVRGGNDADGRSLLRAFEGREDPPPLPQYSESLASEVGFGMAPLFAVRSGGFKYIRAPRPELYDLAHDPRELHNLYAANGGEARRLGAQLTAILQASGRHALRSRSNPMTAEDEQNLQALGYLAPAGERGSMAGIDPKDGLPLHNKLEEARHFAQQSQWEPARKRLLEILAVLPRNTSAMNILGLVAVRSGDAAGARQWYEQSMAVDPTQFRTATVLASIALANGDYTTAEHEAEQALAINPHFVEALTLLGFVDELRGDTKRAEQRYDAAVRMDPTFPRVHRRVGDLRYSRDDYAGALDEYRKVLQLTPTDMRATLQAGNCARRLGRSAEAQQFFQKAQQLRPDSWVPVYNQACLAAVSGKRDQALELLGSLAAKGKLQESLLLKDPDLVSLRDAPAFAKLRTAAAGSEVNDEDDGE